MAMAGRMPSIESTSGRSMRSRNCRTYVDIDSTNRRCPSASSALNASEDFPDPDGPVTTVSCRCGISTETFLRLWFRAPRMEMVRSGIQEKNNLNLQCHPSFAGASEVTNLDVWEQTGLACPCESQTIN